MDLPSRQQVLQALRADGQHIAAVFPAFYPRELLRAFGFHPIELWAPPVPVSPAVAEHFQSYTCAIARAGVAFLQAHQFREVDAVLVPHTCDSLQGVGSVLRDFIKPAIPVLTLYHPRGGHACDVEFLAQEIRQLANTLSRHTGKQPSDEALLHFVQDEELADACMRSFYADRELLELTDREFYQCVRSREYLPNNEFIALCNRVPRKASVIENSAIRLCISGILLQPLTLLDALNARGARVVCDDLACGARRLYQSGTSADPFLRMAQRLLTTPPEPTRQASLASRLQHMNALIQDFRVDAVMVYDVKFCEPELFDWPHLREALKQWRIPSLHLEFEPEDGLSNQTLTRLEAFLEVLK